MSDPRRPTNPGPGAPDWQRLLGEPPAVPPSPGFTLRVLTALPPPRRRRERQRTWVLLVAALLAAALLSALMLPALASPARLETVVTVCLAVAALTFWTVSTVAD